MRGLVVVLAVGVLLTGCSSATPSATPTDTPTPSDTVAPVVAAWATRVAEIASPYDEWWTQWTTHKCTPSAFDKAPCSADLATGASAAASIQLAIASLTSADALGAPPTEIADLVSATSAAAVKAQKYGNQYNSACPANPEPPQCSKYATQFVRSLEQLGARFAEWSAYR
jgi:hypothetical protein